MSSLDLPPHLLQDVAADARCDRSTWSRRAATRATPTVTPTRSGHRWPTSPTPSPPNRYRAGTEPVPVTVGGYDGLYVELSVPDDIDVAACPGGVFPMWQGRWQEHPGQVDMVWIVDVEGQRVVFDASHMADASPEQVNHLKDMVTTATFAPARGI